MGDLIDEKKLPLRPMFDTSVLIPGLGGRVRTKEDAACKPLVDAMGRVGREFLIAAPSFAEYLRKAPKGTTPRIPNAVIMAFDERAAELLGQKFPKHVLVTYRDVKNPDARPMDYIKYDAMIVACAMRHRADVFVSCDDDHRRLMAKMGLSVRAPTSFFGKQRELDYPAPGSTSPSSASSAAPLGAKPGPR